MEEDEATVCLAKNDMSFLYDDLEEDIYNKRDEKLEENLKKITEELNFYKNENEELHRLVKEQENKITILNKNISSLYLTSKRELDRKAEQMKAMSQELDQYILSGRRPLKRPWKEEERDFPKRFKRDASRDSHRTNRPESKTDIRPNVKAEDNRNTSQSVNYNIHKITQEPARKVDQKFTTTMPTVDLTDESVSNNAVITKQVQGDSTDLRKQITLKSAQKNREKIETTITEPKQGDSIHSRKQSELKDTFIPKIEPIQLKIETATSEQDVKVQSNSKDTFHKIETIQNELNIETTKVEQVQEGFTSSSEQIKPNDGVINKVEPIRKNGIKIEMVTTEQVQEGNKEHIKRNDDTVIHKMETIQKDRTNTETKTTEQVQDCSSSSRDQTHSNHEIEQTQLNTFNIETAEQVRKDSTKCRNENNCDSLKHENEMNATATKAIAITQDQGDCFSSKKENQRDHNHNKNTGSDRIDRLQNIELKIDKSTVEDQNKTESQRSKEAEKIVEVNDLAVKPEKKPVWRIPKISSSERSKKDQDEKLTRKETTTDHRENSRTVKERSKNRICKNGKIERKIDKPTKNNRKETDNHKSESKRSKDKETTRKDMPQTEVKTQRQVAHRTQKTEKERTEPEKISENKYPVWKGNATDYKQVQQILREGIINSHTVLENHCITRSGQNKKVDETARKDVADSNQSSGNKLDGIHSSDKTSKPSAQKMKVEEDKPTQREPEIKEDTAGPNQGKGSEPDNKPQSEESNNKETTKKDVPDRSRGIEKEPTKEKTESDRSKKEGRDSSRSTSREVRKRSERSQERQNHNRDDRRKCREDDRQHKDHDHHRYEEDYRRRFEEVQKRYLENDWKRSHYDRRRYEEYDRRRRVDNDRNRSVWKTFDTVDPRNYRGSDRNWSDRSRRFKENSLKKCGDDQKRRDSDPGRYTEDWRRFRSERDDYMRRNHESKDHRSAFEEKWTGRLLNGRKESCSTNEDGAASPKATLNENKEESSIMDTSALLSLPEDHLEELLKSRQEKLKKLEEMESKPSLTEDNTLLDSCADQWDTNAVDEWIPLNEEEKPENKTTQKSEELLKSADMKQKPSNIKLGQVQETPNDNIERAKLISDLLKSESAKLKCTKHSTEVGNGKTSPKSNSKVSYDHKCEYVTGKKRNAPPGSPCKSKKQKMESIEVPVHANEEQKTITNTDTDFRNNIEPKLDVARSTKEIELEPEIVNNTVNEKDNCTEEGNVSTDIVFKIAENFNGGRILRVPKNKIIVKSVGDIDVIEIEDTIDSVVINKNNTQSSNKHINTEQPINTISFKNAINNTVMTDVKVGGEQLKDIEKVNPIATSTVMKTKTQSGKPVKNPRTKNKGKPKTQNKPRAKQPSKAKTVRPRPSNSKTDGVETSLEVLFHQNEAPVRKSPRLLERQQALAVPTQSKSESVQMKSPKTIKDVVYSLFGSMDSIIEEMEEEKKSLGDSTTKSHATTSPSVIILSDIKLREGIPCAMDQIKAGTQVQCNKTDKEKERIESKNTFKNVPLDKIAQDLVTTTPIKQPSGLTCPETVKSPRKKSTFDPKAQPVTPSVGAPKRRITPIRISNSVSSRNSTCSNSAMGLRLTQDGQIPLLNLEENHFTGLSTESIQENSIIHLLNTMNVINLEGETLRFQSNLGNDINTSVDSIANLTFSNFMDKVSSTPNTARQEESEGKPVQPTGTPSMSRRGSTGKRRRCKMLMLG